MLRALLNCKIQRGGKKKEQHPNYILIFQTQKLVRILCNSYVVVTATMFLVIGALQEVISINLTLEKLLIIFS